MYEDNYNKLLAIIQKKQQDDRKSHLNGNNKEKNSINFLDVEGRQG